MVAIFKSPIPDDGVLHIPSGAELCRTVQIVYWNDVVEYALAAIQIYRYMSAAGTRGPRQSVLTQVIEAGLSIVRWPEGEQDFLA